MTKEDEEFIRKVKNTICDMEGISLKRMMSKEKTDEVAIPRHIIRYILRLYGKLTFQTIADNTGCKKHETVLHSYTVINNEIPRNKALKRKVAIALYTLSITPTLDIVENGRYPFVGVIKSVGKESKSSFEGGDRYHASLRISPLPKDEYNSEIPFQYTSDLGMKREDYANLIRKRNKVYLEFVLKSIKIMGEWTTELEIKSINLI